MTHRTTRPRGATTAVAAGAIAALAAPSSAQQESGFCNFAAVDARAQRILEDFPALEGVGVLVADRSGVVHEAYFGAYDASTIVPLASASKLISAAAVMTLADGGPLNLSAPVRVYLPEFAPEIAGTAKSLLTADQMYSMTSGLPGDDAGTILGNPFITNDQAVAQIACCVELVAEPSTDLRYGGYGMHTVGRIAEVLSGMEFDAFFDAAIAAPLGITTMTWDGLGETENFRPSGGGASSLPDYARVLRMLLRRGELDGVRVLSEGAVQSMFVERTVGLPQAQVPPSAGPTFGYAFGMWVERRTLSGFPAVLTSPGAFGFTPVVDIQDNYVMAVMVRGSNGDLDPSIDQVRDLVDEAMARGCASCAGDLNRDGLNNVNDVVQFVNGFNGSAPIADVFADARYDVNDVVDFVNAFNAGCP